MSAYLSPILSSGDSTPVENLISEQSCVSLIRDENEAKEVIEFQACEFKQHQNNGQQQQQTLTSINKQHIQQTTPETDKKSKANRQKLRLVENLTSEEELSGRDDDEDDSNDEDAYQSDRLKFTASQQNYQRRPKSAASKTSDTSTQPQFHKPHQCLADQFLSMTASGKIEHNSTRSSSFVSSECELLNGSDSTSNNSNRSNSNNNGDKLRNLLTSAAYKRQRISKKLRQILRSIPMVPLVATTSIMTIILLSLLLLSDTLHLATASHSHNANEPESQQQQHTAVAGNMNQRQHGRPQMQSLVMGARTGQLDAGQRDLARSEPFADEGPKLDGGTGPETAQPSQPSSELPTRMLNLRRELVGNLFAQRQQQRHHHHRNHRQLQQRQQPIGLEHADTKLSHHASEKRQSIEFPADERAHDLGLAGERVGQKQVGENQVGLLDSLGAMLFGAGANQQQQAQSAAEDHGQLVMSEGGSGGGGNSDERQSELVGAGQEDEETRDERRHADFMLDGVPQVSPAMAFSHRPAHLLSSALELDLSPEQQQNPNKQQPARTKAANPHLRQQQQQHVGKHPHRQSRPPMLDRQQQQQQQQQQQNADKSPVPSNLVQCNKTAEGFEMFNCATPDSAGRYRCIEDFLFCDGYKDCPLGEDEDPFSCMFYKISLSHIDILTNTFLTWIKTQTRQAANDINSNNNNNNNNNQHHHSQQALELVSGELED